MYKAIGFDVGGVILDYTPAKQIDSLSAHLKVDRAKVIEAYAIYKPQADLGQLSSIEFWTSMINATGSDLEPVSTLHLWNDGYINAPIIEGMLELAKGLKSSGYKVGIFSNLDHDHGEINKERGLFKDFETVLLSYELGVIKPHPEAFRALVREMDIEPEELLFIDDVADNIRGAELVGASGVVFAGYEDLLKQLAEAGVLHS